MMRDNSVSLLTLLDSLTLQSTDVAFVNITSLINDIDQQIMNTDFIEPVNKSTWLAFSNAFYSTSEPSTVSNENYLSLWENTLILRGNYNKLIKKYTKKVGKAVNPQSAFRFFLIVEKVKTTVAYGTIQNLPLVKN